MTLAGTLATYRRFGVLFGVVEQPREAFPQLGVPGTGKNQGILLDASTGHRMQDYRRPAPAFPEVKFAAAEQPACLAHAKSDLGAGLRQLDCPRQNAVLHARWPADEQSNARPSLERPIGSYDALRQGFVAVRRHSGRWAGRLKVDSSIVRDQE